MLDGKEAFVGVAGRTLTEACGDLGMEVLWVETEMEGEVMLMEEVDEALEWVWWWWGIERMEEMDEEVDLRPRRPPEERR